MEMVYDPAVDRITESRMYNGDQLVSEQIGNRFYPMGDRSNSLTFSPR